MLVSLHIENLAVIKSLDLEFSSGFTVFSGETGAGKSVILDSIRLLLGARAEKDMIRYGEETAFVSGIFTELLPIADRLRNVGLFPDEDGALMIARSFSTDGHTTLRANGKSVTLSSLREASELLLTIHAQNTSSGLLNTATHIGVLDAYADTATTVAQYHPLYETLSAIRRDIREAEQKNAEKARMTEMLRYQIADIEAVAPKDGEEEKLLEKRSLLRNREKVSKYAGFIYKALRGAEKGSARYLLSRSINALENLTDAIPNADELKEQLIECLVKVDDVAEEISAVSELDDRTDPTELLDKVESRLDAFQKLSRKYGGSIAEVIRFYRNAKAQLEGYENADTTLKKLRESEAEVLLRIDEIANKITQIRQKAATKMQSEVESVLAFLDMPKAVFEICVEENKIDGKTVYNENGKDSVRFLIAANPGEEPKEPKDVASGGELSRMMLALENVIAEKERIPTVIYDEVDTGVSGKTARKIGMKLLESSKTFQIFSITHSAQIASLADTHYHIMKTEVNGRAETRAHVLNTEERVEELSRILGGLQITDVQRKAARALLTDKNDIL